MDTLHSKLRSLGRRLTFRIFTVLFSEMLPAPHARPEREAERGSQLYRRKGFRHDGNRKNLLGMHVSHARVSQTGMLIRVLELANTSTLLLEISEVTHGKPKRLASPDTLEVTSISRTWWKEDKSIHYNAERLPAYSAIPTGRTSNRQVGMALYVKDI